MGNILIMVRGIIYNDIAQEEQIFSKIVELYAGTYNSRGHAFIMAYNTIFAQLLEFTEYDFEIVSLEVLTDGGEAFDNED